MDDETLDLIWSTRDNGPIKVRDMNRSHVMNSLQWCMRRLGISVLGTKWDKENIYKDKDGFYYRDWVAIFTARLLDPALP